jgi:hypothetical protein
MYAITKLPTVRKPKKNKTEEHTLQENCMKYLNLKGWIPVRFNTTTMMSATGIPYKSYLIYGLGMSSGLNDIIAYKGDFHIKLEIKTEKGKLTENQMKVQNYFCVKGTNYYIVRSLKELQDIVDQYEIKIHLYKQALLNTTFNKIRNTSA